jgi:hypothetical protein
VKSAFVQDNGYNVAITTSPEITLEMMNVELKQRIKKELQLQRPHEGDLGPYIYSCMYCTPAVDRPLC